MHGIFSTSAISLHSRVTVHNNENEVINKTNHKPSIIYFLALFYTFLLMGFGSGIVGPTLLKFSEQTNLPLERVIYILFARSCGFLIGTIMGGVFIDHFPLLGRALLTLIVLIMCITTLLIPFIYHLIPMIIVHLMWSLAGGIVDNLAQILTIRHYENLNVNKYLQALHCAFGVGALFAPLIIAPFLRKSSPTDQWHYAYWLIGCIHIPSVVLILLYALRDELCLKKKNQKINLENTDCMAEDKPIEIIVIPDDEKPKSSENVLSGNMKVLAFITIFILLYVGGESAFGAYIHTYASLHLNFNKDIAAYLNSAFWASFAFSRLCGIALSTKYSPVQMLFSDLICSTGAITLLLVVNKSSLILWIGSILFGISAGPIYPSAIAFTEKVVSMTGRRMSILAVGGSTGDAIIPLLIGYTINPTMLGPIGFISIVFIVVILASVLFGATTLYVKCESEKDKHNNR